jgi:hypothetical protein
LLVLDLGLPELDEVALRGHADILRTDPDEDVLVPLDGVSIDGKRARARMGVFDARAEFSGWVEMAPLDFNGCGCASSRAPGDAMLGWFAVIVLGRRRRAAAAHRLVSATPDEYAPAADGTPVTAGRCQADDRGSAFGHAAAHDRRRQVLDRAMDRDRVRERSGGGGVRPGVDGAHARGRRRVLPRRARAVAR